MESKSDTVVIRNTGTSHISAGTDGILLSSLYGVEATPADDVFTTPHFSEGRIMNAQLLYSNSSGTTGDVTLKRSSSNYWRIDIYFSDGSRVQMASTCGSTSSSSISSSCSGRNVSLVRAVSSGSSVMYISSEQVLVTGSEIQRNAQCLQAGIRNGSCELAGGTHRIVAVVGWSL